MAVRQTILKSFLEGRTDAVLAEILPYLNKKDRVLDLGCGSCQIAMALTLKGYKVTPIDIKNLSAYKDFTPLLYDGKKLPFENNSFDVCLLSTVLHHTKNPEAILKEAKRVAEKLIIIEDIYKNPLQKYLTLLMDSSFNRNFFAHPHSNKDDKEWRETFKKLDLKLLGSKYHSWWKIFLSTTYYLKKHN